MIIFNKKFYGLTSLIAALVISVFAVSSNACPGCSLFKSKANKKEAATGIKTVDAEKKVILPVTGMTCSSCSFHVNRALKKLDGVKSAKADSDKGNVVIYYDPEKVSLKKMVEAINKTGYKASLPAEDTPEKKEGT